MGCGCKGSAKSPTIDNTNHTIIGGIFNFIIIMFFLTLISPIIFIGVIFLVFNQTVLNKQNKMSDIVSVVLYLKNKFVKKEEEEDETEDDDELDLENYEIITEKWVKDEER